MHTTSKPVQMVVPRGEGSLVTPSHAAYSVASCEILVRSVVIAATAVAHDPPGVAPVGALLRHDRCR